MKEYVFFINYPAKTDTEETKIFLQSHFQGFTLTCADGLKVIQYMTEAFRGFMIAQGKSTGRYPIRSIEIERQTGVHVEEAIILYKRTPINARIGTNMLLLTAFSNSDEWADELRNVVLRDSRVVKIDIAVNEPRYEIFGRYADIERRLEEGDIDGGAHISQKHPIGYFEEHFPEYRHLFH